MAEHPTTVRGNKGLAKLLGVHVNTVWKWRKRGILKPATLVDCGQVIVYDLAIVKQCLDHQPGSELCRY